MSAQNSPAARAIRPDEIGAAYDRIASDVRRTPIVDANARDFGIDPYGPAADAPPVVFKLECLQHSGSFKARGALNNIASREVPVAGVIAASGGNHGAAVAFAAAKRGVPAHIFVPELSSDAKRQRIREFGAELHVGGALYADALQASEAFAAETGALPIHAYDSAETLAGAGTVALELEEQAPGVDTVLVAVGGGGLIGGIASFYRGRTRVVAVETRGTATLHSAIRGGKPVDVEVWGTAADSLGARQIGGFAWEARQHVAQSVLIDDEAVERARVHLWRTLRIAVEPGGAAAFAALADGAYRPAPGERVAVILCGANTGSLPLSASAGMPPR